MSPMTHEDNNHMRLVIRDIARDMISRKWLFGTSDLDSQSGNSFPADGWDSASVDRLRRAMSRDPVALQALFDMFASAVSGWRLEDESSFLRLLTLAAVDEIHSLAALRARVDATPGGDAAAPKLIEHLLANIDRLNFRSAALPSCVAAAVQMGAGLRENSLTFAIGPGSDDDDGGRGEGRLFVCVPVTGAMGAYGALALWPSPASEVGASEDMSVAFGRADWTDSWNDSSLFGGDRYRSVLVCHAHRHAASHHRQQWRLSMFKALAATDRLPHEIGPPRYLVMCPEQPQVDKPATREQQPVDKLDMPATAGALDRPCRPWQPLALGALLLASGYMVHRYSDFTVRLFASRWPVASFEMFAPTATRGFFKW